MDMKEYNEIFKTCHDLFRAKMKDYGPSWTLFREPSLVDQLWIKIKRVRTLEETGVSKVSEGVEPEYIGIINYSIMMLMKLKGALPNLLESEEADIEELTMQYNSIVGDVRALMEKKNHDYGAAWKEMHPFSITDQILTKVYRIKSIMQNDGELLVSENVDAQLMDIINYCTFALMKKGEEKIK